MDLNQLLYNHQRALMNQRQSVGSVERETYFDLVEYYAKRIRECRRDHGISDRRWAIRPDH
jgi:ribosome-binding protein aMBF1 (putative translation factor)